LLQVHDELLFEVEEDWAHKLSADVRDMMQVADKPASNLHVPLVVDSGFGQSWALAH
ncbi:MAG: DNA polymerase, partial [Pseudomonadota bacterium]